MLLTLDIKNESMKDSFINFLKTLDYVEIKQEGNPDDNSSNHKSNKNKFSEFAGMWADRQDITIESIRDKAWKR